MSDLARGGQSRTLGGPSIAAEKEQVPRCSTRGEVLLVGLRSPVDWFATAAKARQRARVVLFKSRGRGIGKQIKLILRCRSDRVAKPPFALSERNRGASEIDREELHELPRGVVAKRLAFMPRK